ncbi:MAG: PRC-barrel domain-containing protein [Bacillota bacterium]
MENLSRKVLSLPVLSVNEGEHLGYVKSLVVDPARKEVTAFVINRKGWFKEDKIIPFNRVQNIGENAIVIDKSGTAEKPANFPQIIKLIKNPARLINIKVVSTTGKALGHVEEFYFDTTGKITKFELGSKITEGFWKGKTLLPCEEVITIGKDVMIVKEGAENRVLSEGKQLKKTMSDLKAVTTKAWDTTVQTSQKLGHAITNSINKLAEEEKMIHQDQSEPDTPDSSQNPHPESTNKDSTQEIITSDAEFPETGSEETVPVSEPIQTDDLKEISEEIKKSKE